MQQIPITTLDEIESVNSPSIPNALLRLLKEVEDNRSSMGVFATLVGQDPAFSASFLTDANSPAMHRKSEATNLEGFITCNSNPGMGTTFSILLPRAKENKQ